MNDRVGVTPRAVIRVDGAGDGELARDTVAVEEPLEIRVGGEPIVTTMRTPGADRELAVGALFAEGVIVSAREIGQIAHCGRVDDPGYGNTIDVIAAPGTAWPVEALEGARRDTTIHASCGVCGRRSIEELLERLAPIEDARLGSAEDLERALSTLRAHQSDFELSGGTHAAALLDEEGALLAHAEDIGRHNAVDKAIGRLLLDEGPVALVLAVSGRVSFEIVQKAACARVPIVCAVSAPTSLAVDLARRLGITLVGFARDDRFVVYSEPGRLGLEPLREEEQR